MRQYGFSLIELMIVILLIGFLALKALPFTGAWVSEATRTETEGIIQEAFGRAKSEAMRNVNGMTSGDPASAICIHPVNNPTLISVVTSTSPATPANCANPDNDNIWQAELEPSVTIRAGGSNNALSCLCFDNRGRLTNNASCSVNTDGCASSAQSITDGETLTNSNAISVVVDNLDEDANEYF